MSIALDEGQVNLKSLVQILEQAYISCTLNERGDMASFTESSVKVMLQFDSDKMVVGLASLWGLKPISEVDKLRFVNRLNDTITVVRFSITSQGRLWCDHQFQIKGGLNPRWFVFEVKRFAEICRGVVTVNSDFME